MKRRFPKIHTVHCGGRWIAAGLIVGVFLPLILWLTLRRFVLPLAVAGGIIHAAFVVVFAVEMHQDFGPVPYYEKHLKETIPYDPDRQTAVIWASVCTGERNAGFRDKADGHITEVMVLRSPEDERRFRKIYGLDEIKTEY